MPFPTATMNEDSVEMIRETRRNILVLNRRKNRDEETDSRRSLRNVSPKKTHPDIITNIANKLKTKSMMSISELQILKNALIDDETYIQTVLNTNGALRGLVRELTGHEVRKQCPAADCCCNLALGDARAGLAVSKSAGPYLVAMLNNQTTELAVTSCWTLGNLAGSGTRACELLRSQGAVAKLVELLDCSNEEMRDAALYALVRFTHQLKNNLRTIHLHNMLSILPRLEVSDTSHLLFILSCHQDFTHNLVSVDLLSKILQYLDANTQPFSQNIVIKVSENLTYIYRFLANCYSREFYEVVLSFFVDNNLVLQIKMLSSNESVIWFLGNAYKLCSDNIFFEMLLK